jgi:hypothetical protein
VFLPVSVGVAPAPVVPAPDAASLDLQHVEPRGADDDEIQFSLSFVPMASKAQRVVGGRVVVELDAPERLEHLPFGFKLGVVFELVRK